MSNISEKPWIVWRLWRAFVANNFSLGGAITDTAVGEVMFEDILYSDLLSAHGSGLLVPGKKYRITDFKTRFNLNISGTAYEDATVEPLIVTAASNDKLEPIAFSVDYPKDIIYYSILGQGYMPGANKGCIVRRIDTEKNISVPFDFREFKVEVAGFNLTAYSAGTYAKGQVVDVEGTAYISRRDANSEDVSNAAWWLNLGSTSNFRAAKPIDFYFGGTLALNTGSIAYTERCFNIGNSYNFVITGQPSMISECLFMTFGYVQDCEFEKLDNCFFNTEDDIINNKCGALKDLVLGGAYFTDNNTRDIRGLLLRGNFQNNTVANGFEENAIYSAYNNNIAQDAKYNIIGEDFKDNQIGVRFQSNSLAPNFGRDRDDGVNHGNVIGNDFKNNVTIGKTFANRIGNNCSGNTCGDVFVNNNIGNNFGSNSCGTNFKDNNLPFDFYSNACGDDFQNWNSQCKLNGVAFSALTTNTADSKYILYDNSSGIKAGYWVGGVMTYQGF